MKRQRARGNSKAGSEADPISYLEAAIKDWKLWVIEPNNASLANVLIKLPNLMLLIYYTFAVSGCKIQHR